MEVYFMSSDINGERSKWSRAIFNAAHDHDLDINPDHQLSHQDDEKIVHYETVRRELSS
jgi:hypothetical protein